MDPLLTVWRQAVNVVHHKICEKLFPQYVEFDDCSIFRNSVAIEAGRVSRPFVESSPYIYMHGSSTDCVDGKSDCYPQLDGSSIKTSPRFGRGVGRSEAFPIRIPEPVRAMKCWPAGPANVTSTDWPGSAVDR